LAAGGDKPVRGKHRKLISSESRDLVTDLVSQLEPTTVEVDKLIAQNVCIELRDDAFYETSFGSFAQK
jgi:hypothetical protein